MPAVRLVTSADRPIVLDLCCRKGGATVGYQRVGLGVVGVDIVDQFGYPGDELVVADALEVLRELREYGTFYLSGVGAVRPAIIHAGPPCQAANTLTAANRARGIADTHVQLVPRMRALLDAIGIPWVIEQPTSSQTGLIRRDLTLCMDMFKGDRPPPWVQKHRSFEISGFTVAQPVHPPGPVRGGSMVGFPKPAGHAGRVRGWRHGVLYEGPYVAAYGKGGGKATAAEAAHAMGIDWMIEPRRAEYANAFDLYEAIPPAYTELIGRTFLTGTGVAA